MKKVIFCLLAIAMASFASASNVNLKSVKSALIKKEVTVEIGKSTVEKKETSKKVNLVFTYCGIMTDGGWVGLHYNGGHADCMLKIRELLHCA